MSGERRETWLDKNLMAVVAAAATLTVGYVSGTSSAAVLATKITSIEARLDKQDALNVAIERRLADRRSFMACSSYALKQIETRLKLEPPCKLEVPE